MVYFFFTVVEHQLHLTEIRDLMVQSEIIV